MKTIKLILVAIFILSCSSCKSDADKMIEKCNAFMIDLETVHSYSSFIHFTEKHSDDIKSLKKAALRDSIYSQQNIEDAMPHIFESLHKYSVKEVETYIRDNDFDDAWLLKFLYIVSKYSSRLPYCTKVSQLESMVDDLKFLYMSSQMDNAIEPTLRLFLLAAKGRRYEIGEGNLYDSAQLTK